ncbi:hypothetical protein QCD60_12685 [Pokkaliibacter sp. MBI-7]|uniref:HipA family kinase n=1 Tax=Pokkaliibacter sp. MBI-7 TaxID=3040600 RepID=UPI0024484273|nr:HipA family kinase [Pokkaliibacter sp. MBI-7]MDH2433429.1 hypothetical protein [Pokkaliibacter sp. MBI-7]
MLIEEVIRRVDRCALNPFLCRTEDGRQFYVKGLNTNYTGLINEWICYRLARLLSLPVPEAELLEIPRELYSSHPNFDWRRDLSVYPLFGSQAIPNASPIAHAAVHGVDSALQLKVFIFDYWIQNEDRTLTSHGGNPNLLINTVSNDIFIIDHNLAFDSTYSVEDSRRNHIFSSALREQPVDLIVQDTFKEKLAQVIAHWPTIVNSIPPTWIEGLEGRSEQHINNIEDVLLRFNNDAFWGALA